MVLVVPKFERLGSPFNIQIATFILDILLASGVRAGSLLIWLIALPQWLVRFPGLNKDVFSILITPITNIGSNRHQKRKGSKPWLTPLLNPMV